MTRKQKIALLLFGLLVALIFVFRRGKVTAGEATILTPKGANVDTEGCMPGFRLRKGRGRGQDVCVARFGDDQRVFEPFTGKLLVDPSTTNALFMRPN